MNKPNAVIVCVDYWDLLALTLPYNRHHFNQVIIVTAPNQQIPDWIESQSVIIHITDDFYTNGAIFNKWLPLEQGLELAGEGWLCILDADIVLPKYDWLSIGVKTTIPQYDSEDRPLRFELDTDDLTIGNLYTPLRRMSPILAISDEYIWDNFPIHYNIKEWSGYCQIFHSSDPVLGPRPWHETNWKHAGGADTFFQAKWPEENKCRPMWQVLHLGQEGRNWCGRVTDTADGSLIDFGTRIGRIEKMRMIVESRRATGNYDNEKF